MTITPSLFEAFLKCPTKCWLRFTGEPPAGNTYAEWVQTEHESYREDAAKRLIANAPAAECAVAPIAENLKTAQWPLAVDVPVQIELRSSRGNEAQTSSPEINQSLLTSAATIVGSRLHAVERIPSEGRGKPAQFLPIRFVFRNKLTQDDRLLLAFDALVLSQVLGREVSLGKIIYGDDHATLKVKTGEFCVVLDQPQSVGHPRVLRLVFDTAALLPLSRSSRVQGFNARIVSGNSLPIQWGEGRGDGHW